MSTLKVNNLQVGQDGTAANNYTLYQPASPDGTVRLGYGVAGSVTDILTLKNSSLGIGTNNPGQILHLSSDSPRILLTETTNNSNCYLDYATPGVLELSVDDNNVDANSKFQVRIDGATASLTLDSNGRVGIGTTSPTANFKLDINGDLTLGESGGSDNTYIDQKQNGSLNIINSGRQSSAGGIRINKTNSISGDTTYYRDLEVYDGKNNLLLLVDGSASKVGINKNSPSSFLHVAGGDYQTLRLENTDNGADGPYIELYNNSSSPADNDYTGIISFKNRNSNNEEITYSQIRSQSVDVTDGAEDGNITFHTRFNGSFGERLRIIENGMLGIGHHSAAQITKELTIRPANDGGIMIGRPGDTVTPINAHLLLTTTSAGQVFPSGEAYTVKYNTRNCDAIFTTYEGGGTGGNISFQTGVGNGNSTERLRITPDGQLQATGAADVRLTLGSGGTAGTNDSVHVRADGANLKFMAASGGSTIFETNGTETVNINSSGRITASERIYVGETYNISNVSGSIGGVGGTENWLGLKHGTTFGLILKTAGSNVGNVGIGETEPVDRLVVQETNASGDVAVRIKNDTLTDGTAANPTTASLYLNTSTGDFNTFYIQARRNDNDTHFGYADPRGANHVPTMVITNEGNVYIGKTSADRTANGFAYSVGTNKDDGTLILTNARTSGGSAVEINRSNSDGNAISFYRAGTSEGTISVNSSGTTYNTTSDIRLKTDINPISDATDKLMNMNPVTHKWKENPDSDTVHGFIAQEMQNIAPEAVHGEPDGEMMMGMDYGRITPIIVAALQNAIKEINTLKQRISELEN